jgi:hypothetical protein
MEPAKDKIKATGRDIITLIHASGLSPIDTIHMLYHLLTSYVQSSAISPNHEVIALRALSTKLEVDADAVSNRSPVQ